MEGTGMGIYGLEGVKSVLLMGLQSSVGLMTLMR